MQTLRKLCAAHAGVAQPQKRACLRGTLDACAGRVLELRAWLAGLNAGVDVLGDQLGEQLVALGLTPDALELPVPAYFREARAAAVAARAEAAAAAVAGAAAGVGTVADQPAAGEAESAAAGAEQGAGSPAAAPAEVEEQGEPRPQQLEQQEQQEQQQEQQQQPGDQRQSQQGAAPASLPPEEGARRAAAVLPIQAAARGWLARRSVAAQRQAKMEFLGMLPPAGGGRSTQLAAQLAAVAAERKQRQVGGLRESGGAGAERHCMLRLASASTRVGAHGGAARRHLVVVATRMAPASNCHQLTCRALRHRRQRARRSWTRGCRPSRRGCASARAGP